MHSKSHSTNAFFSRRLLARSLCGVVVTMGLAGSICLVGCNPGPSGTAMKSGSNDAHHHDHVHPAHGPNGGHLVDLEPSDVHAEWVHDDESNTITVYLDDLAKKGKKIESGKIVLDIKGQPTQEYPLEAKDGNTLSVKNLELVTAIEMTSEGEKGGVKAKLIVKVDSGEESAELVHHDHSH